MAVWRKIARSNFVIRLRSWEYWPFGIVQFPLFIYWIWLSIRARSPFFFSASNPGIAMGGMFGESKYDVIKKIPEQYIPKTILIKIPVTAADVLEILHREEYKFPVIFKPELGERGFMVKKISSLQDIENYLLKVRVNFLVQELIDLPLEYGVFYRRFPNEKEGEVISVVVKEMLKVAGDGKSTLQELIQQKDRAKLQWNKLKEMYFKRLSEVVPSGKVIELVSIGNHAQGTTFLNGNNLINGKLSAVFDVLSKQIDGFYFGRFDLRCATIENLYEGKIKIMELNGCGAEPAHIYHPNFPLWKAIRILFQHWSDIFVISKLNHQQGVNYISWREAYLFYKKFKAATTSS